MTQEVKQPDVSITRLGTQVSPTITEHKVLMVGQQLAAGSATEKLLYSELGSQSAVEALFGARSELAGMYKAFRVENTITQVDAIPLDDNSGTAASATVIFTGPAGADGTIDVIVGSAKNHKYSIPVTDLDSVTVIGDALEALITADTSAPFTASNAAGTVTITFSQEGTIGNDITLSYEGEVTDVTTSLTAFASGATDPVVTGIYSVIGDARYQTIIIPDYAKAVTKTLLDGRWDIDNEVLDGVAFFSLTDSVSNLNSALASDNSQNLVVFGNKLGTSATDKGSDTKELDYAISSTFGAIRALRFKEDQNISDIVAGNVEIRDRKGGIHTPSLPYFNTPLSNIEPVETGLGFTDTEIEGLTTADISIIGNNSASTGIVVGEVPTSYKTDSQGNADVSFSFLNFRDTYSVATEYIFNNLKTDYAQSRLTEGDLVDGLTMANEAKIRGSMIKYYQELSSEGLVQAGGDAVTFFEDNLTISLTLSTGTVTITMTLPIVTQLRTIVITSRLSFTVS